MLTDGRLARYDGEHLNVVGLVTMKGTGRSGGYIGDCAGGENDAPHV